jgi:hypothetical protein
MGNRKRITGFTRTTPVLDISYDVVPHAVSVRYKPRPKTIVVPTYEAWAVLTDDVLLRYEAVVKASFGTICTNKV